MPRIDAYGLPMLILCKIRRLFTKKLVQPTSLVKMAAWASVVLIGSPVQGGVVTAMDAEAMCAIHDGPSSGSRLADSPLCRVLSIRFSALDSSLPVSPTTSGSSSSSSTGGIHSVATGEDPIDVPAASAQAWMVFESTLAFSRLFPSGLFRPPCA
jgi:hypothetical protein